MDQHRSGTASGGGTVDDEGFDFGQEERLTRRLHGLVRSYPRGVGIIKEFIQNADDAGAKELRVILDARQHNGSSLPDARMGRVLGPALVFANDARFTDDDLKAIRRLSESSKVASGPKTGRFGLGFNSAYNVTDYPSFVTNNCAYCFDPHHDMVQSGSNGRGWNLQTLWTRYPDWLRTFEIGGLTRGAEDHAGTIFRLPLRTEERATVSEISPTPFAESDFDEMVGQAQALGSALVLFTRSLERLVIERVTAVGRQVELEVEASDRAALQRLRAPIATALDGTWADVLASWCGHQERLPQVVGTVVWSVRNREHALTERWRVRAGLARGPNDALLSLSRDLAAVGEKAVPLVGVAARLGNDDVPMAITGRLYCALPLPVEHGQPVHINASFDLDDSRQHLTTSTDASGSDIALRAHWNHLLLSHAVPLLWVSLLTDLAPKCGAAVYDAFPKPDGLLAPSAARVYELLRDKNVIRVRQRTTSELMSPTAARMVPKSVRTPLEADGFPIPDPDIPPHVRAGFGEHLRILEPKELRDRFRRPTVEGPMDAGPWPLSAAPNEALRRRDWVEAVARFALSDGLDDAAGLPFALLRDGKLHTIGAFVYYLASPDQEQLFAGQPQWFFDMEFAESVGIVEHAKLFIREMTPIHVASQVEVLLKTSPRTWAPEGATFPNHRWLESLLVYLNAHVSELGSFGISALTRASILPGSDDMLHAPASDGPPLLLPHDGHPTLRRALNEAGVLHLAAPATILEAFRRLGDEAPEVVPCLTPSRLIDRLATLWELPPDVEPLLDFLAARVEDLDTEELQVLRRLQLFPTVSGERVTLSDVPAFLPSAFRPPQVPVKVHLLKDVKRWARLYEALGVDTMGPTAYLVQALLPSFGDLEKDAVLTATEWLRDHLTAVLADVEDEDELKNEISELKLVLGPDGELHKASELHDPDVPVILEVLGSAAKFPHAGAYQGKRDTWMRFFRTLGLVTSITADLLMDHLANLVNDGSSDYAARLKPVLGHLNANWQELRDMRVAVGVQTATLADALRTRAWLPAKRTSKRPAFVVPADRAFRPAEIALAGDEDLACSQRPVAALEITADLAKDLGIQHPPPASIVLEHLDALLDAWEDSPGDPKAFTASFDRVYRHLDRYFEPKARLSLDLPARTILARIKDRDCLWDSPRARLWDPQHVFATPVPFFGSRRAHVHIDGGNHFLDALGRRREPSPGDYESFLLDVAEDRGEMPLADEERNQVIHALQMVAEVGAEAPLPLLTRGGHLALSSELYWDDAPWLADHLDKVPLAAAEVPPALLKRLNVLRVSENVTERLRQMSQSPVSQRAVDSCRRLEQRLRSSEFSRGLVRLVRHDHESPSLDIEVAAVRRLRIGPADRISVDVVLAGEEGPIGTSDVRYYYADLPGIVYLVGESLPRLSKWVVSVVCRVLGEFAPKTLATLEHMLTCDDGEIDEVLNEDRITAARVVSTMPSWQTSAVDEPQLGNPWASVEDAEAEAEEQVEELDAETGSGWRRPANQHQDGDTLTSPGCGDDSTEAAPLDASSSSTPPLPGRPGRTSTGISGSLASLLLDGAAGAPPSGLWEPRGASASESEPPSPNQSGVRRSLRSGYGETLRLRPDEAPPPEIAQEVEEAAMKAAMEYEAENGRNATRMPDGNPGYDIESRDPAGTLTRLIEVKGLAGDWRDRAVELTRTQLQCATLHGPLFWVYVVERTSGTPVLHAIQDPASRVAGFTLPAAWARFAEGVPVPQTPEAGMRVYDGTNLLGVIVEVTRRGVLTSLTLETPSGRFPMPFVAGTHRLERGD